MEPKLENKDIAYQPLKEWEEHNRTPEDKCTKVSVKLMIKYKPKIQSIIKAVELLLVSISNTPCGKVSINSCIARFAPSQFETSSSRITLPGISLSLIRAKDLEVGSYQSTSI